MTKDEISIGSHHHECGGCTLQHMSEADYYALKEGMFHDAVKKAGFDKTGELIKIGGKSRRRANLKISHVTGEPEIGFYAPETHRVIPIKDCPALEPGIIDFIKIFKRCVAELSVKDIEQVLITLTETGNDLVIYYEGTLPAEDIAVLSKFADKYDWARVAVKSGFNIKTIISRKKPIIKFGEVPVAIPEESFLQPTAKGQEVLVAEVLKGVKGAKKIIDLFSGAGTYSLPMAAKAKIHAVEIAGNMVDALKETAAQNKLRDKITTEKRDLFKTPMQAQELEDYDTVVINPPRAGAIAQCRTIVRSNIERVVMVSCSPDTFARDAKELGMGGYKLHNVLGVDQFYLTPHLEIVAVFKR